MSLFESVSDVSAEQLAGGRASGMAMGRGLGWGLQAAFVPPGFAIRSASAPAPAVAPSEVEEVPTLIPPGLRGKAFSFGGGRGRFGVASGSFPPGWSKGDKLGWLPKEVMEEPEEPITEEPIV